MGSTPSGRTNESPPVFYRTSSSSGPLPCFPSLQFTFTQSRATGIADHILPLGDLFLIGCYRLQQNYFLVFYCSWKPDCNQEGILFWRLKIQNFWLPSHTNTHTHTHTHTQTHIHTQTHTDTHSHTTQM